MKSYRASINIAAPPEAVWETLADVANWPSFDPGTERVEGQAAPGAKLTVFSTLAPGRGFPVTITAYEQPARLEWTNSMPLGALNSVRSHVISPHHGGSRLKLSEVVTGAMLAVLGKSLPDLTEPFAAFCDGLKIRVEAGRRA